MRPEDLAARPVELVDSLPLAVTGSDAHVQHLVVLPVGFGLQLLELFVNLDLVPNELVHNRHFFSIEVA